MNTITIRYNYTNGTEHSVTITGGKEDTREAVTLLVNDFANVSLIDFGSVSVTENGDDVTGTVMLTILRTRLGM